MSIKHITQFRYINGIIYARSVVARGKRYANDASSRLVDSMITTTAIIIIIIIITTKITLRVIVMIIS